MNHKYVFLFIVFFTIIAIAFMIYDFNKGIENCKYRVRELNGKFYPEMHTSWLVGWRNIFSDPTYYLNKNDAYRQIKNHYEELTAADESIKYHNVTFQKVSGDILKSNSSGTIYIVMDRAEGAHALNMSNSDNITFLFNIETGRVGWNTKDEINTGYTQINKNELIV